MSVCKDNLEKLDRSLEIPHTNSDFTFPLPSGVDKPVPWTNLEYPPFFNRQQTLLQLLRDCYANVTGYGQMKPKAAVIATSPGYGKTRLLLEWAIRVFHNTEVLQAFVENQELPLVHACKPFEELVQEIASGSIDLQEASKKSRMMFLCTLHETLKKSLIISASINSLPLVPLTNPHDEQEVFRVTDMLCRSISIRNICRRFKGKQIIDDKEVVIPHTWNPLEDEDKHWLTSNGLLQSASTPGYSVFFSLMHVFIALVESNNQNYNLIGARLPKQQLILINIDEAQKILAIEALNRVLAYRVMVHFYDFVAEYPEFNIHVLMVGLYTSDLNKLQDPMRILTDISLPLNPLLSEEYCATVCQTVTGSPITDAAEEIVHILWKQCLGIPRAIQVLHETIQQFTEALKQQSISAASRKKIIEVFTQKANIYFAQKVTPQGNDFGLQMKEWHKELIELSLCLEKPQNGQIGNTTYDRLEGKGILFPVHFGSVESQSATRSYTLPFLFYGPSLTREPSELWEGAASPDQFVPYSPILADIIGGDGSETNTVEQGEKLELACASAIWARYQLKADDQYQYLKMQELVSDWKYNDHYVRFTGILKATKQITAEARKVKNTTKKQEAVDWTFNNMIPHLKQAQAIIINKANSKFADVMLPVLKLTDNKLTALKQLAQNVKQKKIAVKQLQEAESEYIRFLLVQCKNVHPESEDIQPAKIVKDFASHNLLPLMDQGHIFVLLSPNLPSELLLDRAHDAEAKNLLKKYQPWMVESTGAEWLSKLFVLTYHITKSKKDRQAQNNNNQEDKKRKAATQDEVDTTEKKRQRTKKNK